MRSAEIEDALRQLHLSNLVAPVVPAIMAYIAQLEASQSESQSNEPHQDNSPEGAFAAGMESQANALKPYVEHLEAENKRLRGLLSALVPTREALVAAKGLFELGVNFERMDEKGPQLGKIEEWHKGMVWRQKERLRIEGLINAALAEHRPAFIPFDNTVKPR